MPKNLIRRQSKMESTANSTASNEDLEAQDNIEEFNTKVTKKTNDSSNQQCKETITVKNTATRRKSMVERVTVTAAPHSNLDFVQNLEAYSKETFKRQKQPDIVRKKSIRRKSMVESKSTFDEPRIIDFTDFISGWQENSKTSQNQEEPTIFDKKAIKRQSIIANVPVTGSDNRNKFDLQRKSKDADSLDTVIYDSDSFISEDDMVWAPAKSPRALKQLSHTPEIQKSKVPCSETPEDKIDVIESFPSVASRESLSSLMSMPRSLSMSAIRNTREQFFYMDEIINNNDNLDGFHSDCSFFDDDGEDETDTETCGFEVVEVGDHVSFEGPKRSQQLECQQLESKEDGSGKTDHNTHSSIHSSKQNSLSSRNKEQSDEDSEKLELKRAWRKQLKNRGLQRELSAQRLKSDGNLNKFLDVQNNKSKENTGNEKSRSKSSLVMRPLKQSSFMSKPSISTRSVTTDATTVTDTTIVTEATITNDALDVQYSLEAKISQDACENARSTGIDILTNQHIQQKNQFEQEPLISLIDHGNLKQERGKLITETEKCEKNKQEIRLGHCNECESKISCLACPRKDTDKDEPTKQSENEKIQTRAHTRSSRGNRNSDNEDKEESCRSSSSSCNSLNTQEEELKKNPKLLSKWHRGSSSEKVSDGINNQLMKALHGSQEYINHISLKTLHGSQKFDQSKSYNIDKKKNPHNKSGRGSRSSYLNSSEEYAPTKDDTVERKLQTRTKSSRGGIINDHTNQQSVDILNGTQERDQAKSEDTDDRKDHRNRSSRGSRINNSKDDITNPLFQTCYESQERNQDKAPMEDGEKRKHNIDSIGNRSNKVNEKTDDILSETLNSSVSVKQTKSGEREEIKRISKKCSGGFRNRNLSQSCHVSPTQKRVDSKNDGGKKKHRRKNSRDSRNHDSADIVKMQDREEKKMTRSSSNRDTKGIKMMNDDGTHELLARSWHTSTKSNCNANAYSDISAVLSMKNQGGAYRPFLKNIPTSKLRDDLWAMATMMDDSDDL